MRKPDHRSVGRTTLAVHHLFLIAVVFSTAAFYVRSTTAAIVDPLADGPTSSEEFEVIPANALAPPTRSAEAGPKLDSPSCVRNADFQPNDQSPFNDDAANAEAPPAATAAPAAAPPDPCSAAPNKLLNQLGINIDQPAGKLPNDL